MSITNHDYPSTIKRIWDSIFHNPRFSTKCAMELLAELHAKHHLLVELIDYYGEPRWAVDYMGHIDAGDIRLRKFYDLEYNSGRGGALPVSGKEFRTAVCKLRDVLSNLPPEPEYANL